MLARLRNEDGFTLVELLVVMFVLSFVLTGISVMFSGGINATAHLTRTFTSATSLHAGMDRMRTDVHLACSQTAQSATSVTISGPPCDGTNLITWCTRSNGSAYSLYRISGSSCTGGVDLADYITNSSGNVFTYYAQNATAGTYAKPRVHVDMTINADTSSSYGQFRVIDDMFFLNGARS